MGALSDGDGDGCDGDGDGGDGDDGIIDDAFGVNLWPYFSRSAFADFDDDPGREGGGLFSWKAAKKPGFFALFAAVFAHVDDCEARAWGRARGTRRSPLRRGRRGG